jgi:hypothetical protein
LVEFVAECGDCDHQRADDEVEDIVASHCRTPEDIFAILPRNGGAAKSGRAWRGTLRRGLADAAPAAVPTAMRPNQDFVKCAPASIALTSRDDLRREFANGSN